MENEYVKEKANYIWKIMRNSPFICMSWGTESPEATVYKGMAALAFKVNGFLYKGIVVVAYNGGDDVFEVFTFFNFEKGIVEKHITNVYFDNLISVIDGAVETDNDKSAEYQEKVDVFLSRV